MTYLDGRESWVGCPRGGCGSVHFRIEPGEREYRLVCSNGHLLRLFFQLTMPPVPPPPERSEHAVAQVTRPDR
jgi:hypothetical protein